MAARLLVLLAVGLPLLPIACSQGPAARSPKRIIYLNTDGERPKAAFRAFGEALKKEGVLDRHRVALEHVILKDHSANSVREAVSRALKTPPDVIAALSGTWAVESRKLTRDIPIVYASRADPIDAGLMAAMDERATNMVGISYYLPMDWKRLELLREIHPAAKRIGLVADSEWAHERKHREFLEQSARFYGITWEVLEIETLEELQAKVARATRIVDSWFVTKSTPADQLREQTVRVLEGTGKPVIYSISSQVAIGGLVSYDANFEEPYRILARQIGLVLDGVPASEIPVVRPKRYELAINSKTLARLGIHLPPQVAARVDKVY